METRTLFSISLLLAGGLGIAAFPAAAQVPTLVVQERANAVVHVAEATLEAVREATVAARVPGRIVALPVDAGDVVEAGQVIVRIDSAEADQAIAAARAVVAQAEAHRANAAAEHRRAQSLHDRAFVSPSAVDQARTALLAAEAQLQAARAALEQATAARAYTTIVAPLSGVLSVRHREPGEMAMPGMPLVTVFDPQRLRAVADVPQARLAGLDSGALSAWVELPGTKRRVEAERVIVLPAADPRTHTLRLRVDLPAGAAGGAPGGFARVHLLAGEATMIRIPAEAVVRRSEITGVYVADARHVFSLRQIRTGPVHPDGTVAVLAGLAGGEEIALDPVAAGIAARAARSAGR